MTIRHLFINTVNLIKSILLIEKIKKRFENNLISIFYFLYILLTQQGISQYELAKRSILAETTISGIMNERWKTTTLSTIERISDGFGLSISQFLDSPLFDHDKFNN